MKPDIIHSVSATREAIETLFGREIAKRYASDSRLAEYATALKFPFRKVVVSGELRRALMKMNDDQGPTLVVAFDLTREARDFALEANCYLLTLREFFGWTDESYKRARQNRYD